MTVCIRRVLVVAYLAGFAGAFLAGSVAGTSPALAQSVSDGPETLSYQAAKPRIESRYQGGAQTSYYEDQHSNSAPRRATARATPASTTQPAPAQRSTKAVYAARRTGGTEEISSRRMSGSPSSSSVYEKSYDEGSQWSGGDCNSCNGPPETFGEAFSSGRRGCWFIGAEAYFARMHSSEAVSYVDKVLTMDEDENLTTTDTSVEYEFPYQSNFRGYLGYKFCDCCTEIRFSYWHYQNHQSKATDPVPEDLSEIFGGQLENNAGIPGDRLFDDFKISLNTYDIDFSKCIPMGCDDCCCPPWEMRWNAGLKIANVRRNHNNLVTDADDLDVSSGEIEANFFGVGPKVGLEGRRFCNECRSVSIYAKSNLALMVGDYEVLRRRRTPPTEPVTTTVQIDDITRLIPYADIEVGTTWQIFRHTQVSIGWVCQAFWDLGVFESIQGSNFGPMDDANILSFDGGFVRVEMCF
jgi:hypothetical protein